MKFLLSLIACFFALQLNALEYQLQFENEHVIVGKAKILPYEEIGLHRDTLPQVVIASKGGTIVRLEANGKEVPVEFPTGIPVFRPVDPENVLHKSVNRSSEAVELLIIQLK